MYKGNAMVTIKQMISHADTTTREEIRVEVYCDGEVNLLWFNRLRLI